MKKLIAITLLVSVLLSLCSVASALNAGDLNGNGRITAYDAQMVDESLHGVRTLTDEQKNAAIALLPSEQTIGVGHILAILGSLFRNEVSPVGGYYQIWTQKGMLKMMSILNHPEDPEYLTAKFRLMADVDMQGIDWTPGVLMTRFEGNHHSVYNLSVQADDSSTSFGCLFTAVGSSTVKSASVSSLTLVDPSLTTLDSTTIYAGCLCGTNYGSVTDCDVQNAKLLGKTKTGGAAGMLVGINRNILSLTKNSFGSIEQTHTNCCGVCGYSAPTASISLAGGVDDTMTEAQLRQKAVSYMYTMGTTEWTLGRDISYDCSCGADFCKHNYLGSTTYYGLPYTHKQGSLERAVSVFSNAVKKDDGSYVLSDIRDYAAVPLDLSNETLIEFSSFMGNDCSGAVYNAWSQIANSISFRWTVDMIPTEDNQQTYGVLPVGDYETLTTTMGNLTYPVTCIYDKNLNDWVFNAACDDAANEQKIIDAWLKCKAGDAMVTFKVNKDSGTYTDVGGHARLICEDVVPVYDEQGNLDLDNTIVYTYEQGASHVTAAGNSTTWALHGVTDDPGNTKLYTAKLPCGWSLNQLLGKAKMKNDLWVYLPITCAELQTGSHEQAASYMEAASPVQGRVGSNYRIYSTTVSIADQTSTIYTAVCGFRTRELLHEGEDSFSAYIKAQAGKIKDFCARSTIRSVDLAEHAANIDLSRLTSGQSYPFTVSMLLSTGETVSYTGTYTAP